MISLDTISGRLGSVGIGGEGAVEDEKLCIAHAKLGEELFKEVVSPSSRCETGETRDP